MTIQVWLDAAIRDAETRGLPNMRPLLEALARSTTSLRAADWLVDMRGDDNTPPSSDAR